MSLEKVFTKKKSKIERVLDRIFLLSKKEQAVLKIVLKDKVLTDEKNNLILQNLKKRLKVE